MPDCEVLGIPALEAVRRGGGLNCISWNTTTLQDDIFEESIIGQTNIQQGNKSAQEKLKELQKRK